jgi:hypothetical protein
MIVCFVSIDDSDTHRYTDAPMSFRVFGAGEVGGPPRKRGLWLEVTPHTLSQHLPMRDRSGQVPRLFSTM